MKKVLFVCETLDQRPEQLAHLCKISPERFEEIFDYAPLHTLAAPRTTLLDHERACKLLRETTHPLIVLVGSAVAEAFMVGDMDVYTVFPLSFDEGDGETGKQVRAAIRVIPQGHKWYRKPENTIRAMTVLSDLVNLNAQPMSQIDIDRIFSVVDALGEDRSYWTKKVLSELRRNITEGKAVDKSEMTQLLQSYAKDVEFKENNVTVPNL